VAEFFNRDGLIDYPSSSVRFHPDEVIFTPGTRAGLVMVLEVLGADGSGVVVPRPSWEYDWFVERARKRLVELPTTAPAFLPDPEELDRLLATQPISSVIINNPHNPTGTVYPRALVEELVRVCAERRVYVLYDSVYQRLDYVDAFVNPAFANPAWRRWVVTLSGLSKMDMFGASTGARACWIVLPDEIQAGTVRARDVIANLSAWLVATPSTLAQDWAVAALQSPLAALRRPSPYMRERRDFMVQAADALAPLGVTRTDFGGTFYAPLAFPGLVGEKFERLRNGVRERAVVRNSEDVFDLLLSAEVGGIPFAAFAGADRERYGTWQRLSYGSKDTAELAVFVARVRQRIEQLGRAGTGEAPRPRPATPATAVWGSACTEAGYDAFDALEPESFAAARRRFLMRPPVAPLRLTGTKHPDSSAHRRAQLARAEQDAGVGAAHAHRALTHLEWTPYFNAREEFEEALADLTGPCTEELLDYEGRNISPDWLDVPEKVMLALLRLGVIPGEDRHLLFRAPNPWVEPDEEKIARLLAMVARTNLLFLLAGERLGLEPKQNAVYEITVPQVNSRFDLGALVKVGALYRQAAAALFDGPPDRVDRYLCAQVPAARRAGLLARVARVRLVPLVENVGALAHLPELLEEFYAALGHHRADAMLPSTASFATRFDGTEPVLRVFVAMSDTAEQSGKIAADVGYTLALASRREAERRLARRAAELGEPAPRVVFLIGAGRAGFRGGLDLSRPGVIQHLARADGLTLQGIRADDPAGALRLGEELGRAAAAVALRGPFTLQPADHDGLERLLQEGVRAHTANLLRVAPLIAPAGGLVPQTRVRIRATGSTSYGRHIPTYPEEWGGGVTLPNNRDLRDAWPEGVTLPRAIVFNLICTSLGLPPVTSDLGILDKRAAVLLDRHAPGYREIVASDLPCFIREAVALVFGKSFAESTERHCLRAAAALWVNIAPRTELVIPTCLFAMLYLRYIAEESDSWDEPKEHESLRTRQSELIRDTGSAAFSAICTERPMSRWGLLQTFVDTDDAPRLLLAREMSIDEKREFVDLRIDGWLRTLAEPVARELRAAWLELRDLDRAGLTLRAIRQLVDLEELRGDVGA
ncbi:MAG TPA: phosphoenolpyruvate carboxylase, partial [Polyangia bacterium]